VLALVEGLRVTREILGSTNYPPARRFMEIKEQQFQDAINAAMGMELVAETPAMTSAPVPGQTFEVRARLTNRGGVPAFIAPSAVANGAAITIEGDRGWNVKPGPGSGGPELGRHQHATLTATIRLANDVPLQKRIAGVALPAARCLPVRQADRAGAAARRGPLRHQRGSHRDSTSRHATGIERAVWRQGA
jgi:hypothetical protein